MITCHLRYVIDAHKLEQFEEYAKKWLRLSNVSAVSITAAFFHTKAPIMLR